MSLKNSASQCFVSLVKMLWSVMELPDCTIIVQGAGAQGEQQG